jgi:hypothetical protein
MCAPQRDVTQKARARASPRSSISRNAARSFGGINRKIFAMMSGVNDDDALLCDLMADAGRFI